MYDRTLEGLEASSQRLRVLAISTLDNNLVTITKDLSRSRKASNNEMDEEVRVDQTICGLLLSLSVQKNLAEMSLLKQGRS